MSDKRRVLVLCTGNSCRSQMAEGLINHYLGDRWEAHSAGTEPAGYVHPQAIAALEELGIPMAAARSKSTEEFRGQHFDRIITVCDHAAESCPAWLGGGHTVHLGFPDPAKVTGDETAIRAAFVTTRDAIRSTVLDYLTRSD